MTVQTRVLIVAHQPLAQALKLAALHVFPEARTMVLAYDVRADEAPECCIAQINHALGQEPDLVKDGNLPAVLVLTDVLGATPCNVAHRWQAQYLGASRVLCGANLPMVLRAYTYRDTELTQLAHCVVEGGQGAIQALPA